MPELLNGITAPPPPAASMVTPAPPTAQALIERVAHEPPRAAPPATPLDGAHEVQMPDLSEVTDAVVKSAVEKVLTEKLKVANRAITEKFQKLAEDRRVLEAAAAPAPWTPERIQALLNDPAFSTASQTLLRAKSVATPPSQWEGTSEEWSALTTQEQSRFLALETKVHSLLVTQHQEMDRMEHERVKTKFPDYDPAVVQKWQSDILSGQVSQQTIKEMLWKAANFDHYVENSYRFGREDRTGNLHEKRAGSTVTVEGVTPTTETGKPEQQPGERSSQYFRRLAHWNLSRLDATGHR